MQLRDCPSVAACRLETENVPQVDKGQEGEEGGTSPAALTAGTQRVFRPEPTVKAHSVFGTNKLANTAAR